jgi:hypothetical protein
MALIALMAVGLASCATTGTTSAGSRTASSPSPDGSGATTVSGVIVEGIRSTCRVLDTGNRRYALVGPGVDALREGDRVQVVGEARSELVNPCGAAFVVTDLQRL